MSIITKLFEMASRQQTTHTNISFFYLSLKQQN